MEKLMIEYDGHYVPKALCTIDKLGGADDCNPCHESCFEDCDKCVVQKCFDKLGVYEEMEENNLIPRLKIGTVIYFHSQGWNGSKFVSFIQNEEITKIHIGEDFLNYGTASNIFTWEDVGKKVFLTKEEAEQSRIVDASKKTNIEIIPADEEN